MCRMLLERFQHQTREIDRSLGLSESVQVFPLQLDCDPWLGKSVFFLRIMKL